MTSTRTDVCTVPLPPASKRSPNAWTTLSVWISALRIHWRGRLEFLSFGRPSSTGSSGSFQGPGADPVGSAAGAGSVSWEGGCNGCAGRSHRRLRTWCRLQGRLEFLCLSWHACQRHHVRAPWLVSMEWVHQETAIVFRRPRPELQV